MSPNDATDRVLIASWPYFRVRVVLKTGYSGEFAALEAAVWEGDPRVIGSNAWRKVGDPWRVVLLTLDTGADRGVAEHVARAVGHHPLVDIAAVLEEVPAIWSDANFLTSEVARSRPELYSRMGLLFFIHDPLGINLGENTDEYELEVRTVIPRLPSATGPDDVLQVLHEEFTHWFSSSAGPREKYVRLAQDTWQLWQEHVSGAV